MTLWNSFARKERKEMEESMVLGELPTQRLRSLRWEAETAGKEDNKLKSPADERWRWQAGRGAAWREEWRGARPSLSEDTGTMSQKHY
jgi:hypothetical protein